MKNLNHKKSYGIALAEKTILASIGALLSKQTINKAFGTIYNDIQKEVKILVNSLEEQGKLKTQETKKLIKTVQKKAELEKSKISKKLKTQSKDILHTIQKLVSTLKPVPNQKTKRRKKKRK